MSRLIALNKPFNVLCQFRDNEGRATLADFVTIKGIYPAGRLDRDSEGLLLLTDDGTLQHRISHPSNKSWKTYWVQVEGTCNDPDLDPLRQGLDLKDGRTMPARAKIINQPESLWPRDPPIRERRHIPTTWLEISIHEGRNRQIRRMTAATGFPTLRLIRAAIGNITLDTLLPGEWQEISVNQFPG